MTPMIKVTQSKSTSPWKAPSRSYDGDCGYDLYVSEPMACGPLTNTNIPHNIKIQLPLDTWGWLTARSSTLRDKGLIVQGGVIDGSFRGEILTQVFNPTAGEIMVEEGDRISQLIVMPLITPAVVAVDKLDPTDRGGRGFGSSDNKLVEIEMNEPTVYSSVKDGDMIHPLDPRPKIVTLCGSTKYWQDFSRINAKLTLKGYIVLSVGYDSDKGYEVGLNDSYLASETWELRRKRLDDLHLHKIQMSDEILVLNIDGYISSSTNQEIKFATEQNKVVRYLYPDLVPAHKDKEDKKKCLCGKCPKCRANDPMVDYLNYPG